MHSFDEMLGETPICLRESLRIPGRIPARDITGKEYDGDDDDNNIFVVLVYS
jgi:hypothetical protein